MPIYTLIASRLLRWTLQSSEINFSQQPQIPTWTAPDYSSFFSLFFKWNTPSKGGSTAKLSGSENEEENVRKEVRVTQNVDIFYLVLFNIVQFSNSPCNATSTEQGPDFSPAGTWHFHIKSANLVSGPSIPGPAVQKCEFEVSATPSQSARRRRAPTQVPALRGLVSAVSVS